MKKSWLLLSPDPAEGAALAEVKTLIKTSAEKLDEHGKKFPEIASQLKTVTDDLKKANDEVQKLTGEMNALKKSRVEPQLRQPRRRGMVTDAAASALAAHFIIHCERSGKMDILGAGRTETENLAQQARSILGIQSKTALTASDIPLPTSYSGELRDLVAEYGVVRNQMFPYPLGQGTSRPPRAGTGLTFASIAMSGSFGELSPTVTFASLESHKLGGLVRVPREIDDQSIVAIGQYLARKGATEFARSEDHWGFLADGTSTYESITGVCKTAADNSKLVTLGAGKTSPADATLANLRALRPFVNVTARKGGKYFFNHTWETRLRDFNTAANPNIFMYRPDGTATLDGFEIVWVEVLQEYTEGVAAAAYLAAFGDLQWWWFGERGSPRIDFSEHVFFANDQLATRFMEEIDFDYQSLNAVAVLKTPAA